MNPHWNPSSQNHHRHHTITSSWSGRNLSIRNPSNTRTSTGNTTRSMTYNTKIQQPIGSNLIASTTSSTTHFEPLTTVTNQSRGNQSSLPLTEHEQQQRSSSSNTSTTTTVIADLNSELDALSRGNVTAKAVETTISRPPSPVEYQLVSSQHSNSPTPQCSYVHSPSPLGSHVEFEHNNISHTHSSHVTQGQSNSRVTANTPIVSKSSSQSIEVIACPVTSPMSIQQTHSLPGGVLVSSTPEPISAVCSNTHHTFNSTSNKLPSSNHTSLKTESPDALSPTSQRQLPSVRLSERSSSSIHSNAFSRPLNTQPSCFPAHSAAFYSAASHGTPSSQQGIQSNTANHPTTPGTADVSMISIATPPATAGSVTPVATIGTPVSGNVTSNGVIASGGAIPAVVECSTDETNLTRLSSSLLKHLAAAAVAVGTNSDGTETGTDTGASVEAKRERYPPPPLGKIDDPLTYGINLGITGELVSSSDVETWEFPDMEKLRGLRDRLILFMEENRLKQADICRFTGLGAPYLSFMVKDPTISNFSSRRRVEVYSVLLTFFNKIDRKEVTLEDIARLVLLSKATARAANSRRRGAQAKLGNGTVRRGPDGQEKPVVRRRRRGRPKMLERSREDEFYNSGIKEDEFNFDDFIAGAVNGGDYLYNGLTDSNFGGLSDLVGWSGAQKRTIQRNHNGTSRVSPHEPNLSGSLEEWKQKSPALFREGSFDLMGSASSSGVQTPIGFANQSGAECSKSTVEQNYCNISEVLQRSQNLFNPQNQQIVLQRLVNAAAIHMPKESNTTEENEKQQKNTDASKPIDTVTRTSKEESNGDGNNIPESQTDILNALIHNLIHQQPSKKERNTSSSSSSTHPYSYTSKTPVKISHKESVVDVTNRSNELPTYSLLRSDSSNRLSASELLKIGATLSGDIKPALSPSDMIKQGGVNCGRPVMSSQTPLASILQALIQNQGKYGNSKNVIGIDTQASGTHEPCHIETLIDNGNSKIKFGQGWLKEVDVGLLNSEMTSIDIFSSAQQHEKDSEFSLPLPCSGHVCVVRLQWSWDNGNTDEDILWDMNEVESSIEAFVESYIREAGLPRDPVGTEILQSFKKQVETARSFESMFQAVCHHLQIKLGHSNVKSLPGMHRKIIIDCYHEGLRIIDAISWNLTNSIFEARMFLRSLIHDLNLPTSFTSVLFSAFIRAVAKERLKFIHECSDVLLGHVRSEIAVQNLPEFKRDRKRGHSSQPGTDDGVGDETPKCVEETNQVFKRLRRSVPDAADRTESEKDENEVASSLETMQDAITNDNTNSGESQSDKADRSDRGDRSDNEALSSINDPDLPSWRLNEEDKSSAIADLDEISSATSSENDESDVNPCLPTSSSEEMMQGAMSGILSMAATECARNSTPHSELFQTGPATRTPTRASSTVGTTLLPSPNQATTGSPVVVMPNAVLATGALSSCPILPLTLKPTTLTQLATPAHAGTMVSGNYIPQRLMTAGSWNSNLSTSSPPITMGSSVPVAVVPGGLSSSQVPASTESPTSQSLTRQKSSQQFQLQHQIQLQSQPTSTSLLCHSSSPNFDPSGSSETSLIEALSSSGPLVLRSDCGSAMTHTVLNKALLDPNGLVNNQIKPEEIPLHQLTATGETESRRTTRRSEIGNSQRDHSCI